MPKLSENCVPSYRLHRQSGQAIVTLNGRDVCLGVHGTAQSKASYNRLIAEWLANGRFLPPTAEAITVVEVADQFLQHADVYYRRADGTPTSEPCNFRHAVRPLLKLYAKTEAGKFGPLSLKAVREKMVDAGWCRNSINDQVARIKHMFKWAVENELVPPSVHHGLLAVAGLKAGRSMARESEPVKPASDHLVEGAMKHASAPVAVMIRLQLLTGMRPGEVCGLRGSEIEMTGTLWLYRPASHKMTHHEHARTIYLGPQAQEIVRPFLHADPASYLFSPMEAEQSRRDAMHARRKTPLSYGNSPGTNRKKKPQWAPSARYTTQSYSRAIAYACSKAFPLPPELDRQHGETLKQWRVRLTAEEKKAILAWKRQHRFHPHQLRHSAATRLRKEFGLEAAQVILGHKTLTVTQVYAEKNVEAAVRIMGQIG
jgi:integrase